MNPTTVSFQKTPVRSRQKASFLARVRVAGVPVLFALFASLPIGCAAPDQEPMVEPITYDAATIFDTVSISGGSFSHDEQRVLLTTDESGVFNVYSQPIDGSERTQLTQSTTNATFGISYFPADDRFLFSADEGGNEQSHIYVQELDGSTTDLTPGEKLVASFAGWNKDRSAFFVRTNERDPRNFDLYRYATADTKRKLVYQNDGGFFVSGPSDDERYVGLTKINSNTDSDVFLYDLRTKKTFQVTPDADGVESRLQAFSPSGDAVYYGTNGEGEFNQIWRYDLTTKERTPFLVADWDVAFLDFSENGTYRASGINADGSSVIEVVRHPSGERVALPSLGEGDIVDVTFSPSETKMSFLLNGDRSPSNLFVVDLAKEGASPVQLTRSLSAKVDTEDLVEGEVVRFESTGGLEIPGILYRPKTASADRPVPAMLWMHGGPGGQSRRGYNPSLQHLVNHGYAIFAVNNRGSSGYGKTFFHLDDRKHGEADIDDCVAAKDYLATLDWIDGEHIGIMGGSYGGYLVAAALAFRPDEFDVGIDIFGVTNWLRTLQSMPVWWGPQREALFEELGDPEVDADRLRRISPLFHAKNITKPLLVIQGANDPRVLQVESDELVEAVRAGGAPVEYVIFDDEGHGFRKKDNRIEAQNAYLDFLNTHLKGQPVNSGE